MKQAACILAALLLAGCATPAASRTAPKPQEPELLNTRLSSLEGRIGDLHTRLEELAQAQVRLKEEVRLLKARPAQAARPKIIPSRLSSRQIQRALVTAGFYDGPIDGKIGRRTQQAIRAFQQAEGLRADGIVGTKTAAALVQYLEGEK